MELLEEALVVFALNRFARGRGGWWVLIGENFRGEIVLDWVFGYYGVWLYDSFNKFYLIFQIFVLRF